jgi:predicted helicase
MSHRLGMEVSAEELLAYIAAVVGHPGYTRRFVRDLQRPGVRIPLTANPELWKKAVRIGTEVIWLHTFGERSISKSAVQYPKSVQDLVEATGIRVERDISDAIDHVPDVIRYDQSSQTLHVGTGKIRPVSKRIWEYDVGGMRIISHWFDYRRQNPKHKRRSSPLDNENCRVWSRKLTDELLAVLAVLGRCIDLEPWQDDILGSICEGPLIKTTDLEIATVLPVPAYTRKPPALDDDRGSHLF